MNVKNSRNYNNFDYVINRFENNFYFVEQSNLYNNFDFVNRFKDNNKNFSQKIFDYDYNIEYSTVDN